MLLLLRIRKLFAELPAGTYGLPPQVSYLLRLQPLLRR